MQETLHTRRGPTPAEIDAIVAKARQERARVLVEFFRWAFRRPARAGRASIGAARV